MALEPEQKILSEFAEGYRKSINLEYLARKRCINRKNKNIMDVPHPFLKWAGGKRQLLKQFDSHFPDNYKNYIEPFVGGGTVFFYLLPEHTILIDKNEELINCYKVIQNHIEEIIQSLKQYRNEKDFFYTIRDADRNAIEFNKWTDIERASRTIYLNRCCYNGLYRVNSKGQFNVPFGKYKNPRFCDEENLRAVNYALKNVKIYHDNFEKCLDFAGKDDFIYLDPPYQPLSSTANFTSYTKEGFSENEQLKLLEVIKVLDKCGCKVMLSNSYNEFILNMYNEFNIITVNAKRAINSNAAKRGQIKEALIINY
ncbi:MAG TPA: DNA adenine methylase [Candidatus Deferrimicrobium sp.]|nr:DNA adenine methylase [Candidatus Deferrimicrobium sp.]